MIVMKFGGTSVADEAAIERLIAIVRAARQAAIQPESLDWRGPIVVVSALGGATDKFLKVASRRRPWRDRGERREPPRASPASPRRRPRDRLERRTARGRALHQQGVRRARPAGRGVERAARSHAAMARRDRCHRRDHQQPHRGRRAHVAWPGRDLGRCPPGHRHRPRAHGRAAAHGRNGNRPCDDGRSAARRTPDSGDRRVRRRYRATASPRRWAVAVRTTRRRSSAPASARRRSRSGPTWTACSPPIRASFAMSRSCRISRSVRHRSSRTSARRCCTRRRFSPPSDRTSRSAFSTRDGRRTRAARSSRAIARRPNGC